MLCMHTRSIYTTVEPTLPVLQPCKLLFEPNLPQASRLLTLQDPIVEAVPLE